MGNLTLITGGTRSGKSRLAERLAKEKGRTIVYIATAIPFDEGMQARIKRHREDRPQSWKTIECYRDFNEVSKQGAFVEADTVLLDCVTLMVTNILLESGLDVEACTQREIDGIEANIFTEVNALLKVIENKEALLVTNEVGMGLAPAYKLGSIFRDIAGRVNQYLAKVSDEVYLTVSGIPMKIKGDKG